MQEKAFNTGETQSELRAKYNPEGSILRKAQLRMLDMLIYFDKVCKEQHIPYRLDGVAGLAGIAQPDDVVMIHWSASPFLSEEIISDNIRVCREKGNAMTASYSYLLYGTNDGECARKAINRDTFKTLSAPQSFLYKVITDIYRQVEEKNLFDSVEPHTTAFMTELGIPIYFSKGSHTNMKITTKDDIDLFLGYLLAQKYKENE